LKFLASNLNTVLPIIIIFHFDLFDGPFRPFDGPFRPVSKKFDRIRPFSSWAGKNGVVCITNLGSAMLHATTLALVVSVVLYLILLLLIDPQLYIPTTRNMYRLATLYYRLTFSVATFVALLTFSIVVCNYCCKH
jgi:hypothetical protein